MRAVFCNRTAQILRLSGLARPLHHTLLGSYSPTANQLSGVFQFRPYVENIMENINKEELKKKLTPIQYTVTQEKGTERPFTGEYDKVFDDGMYSCIVCGQDLFSSKTKFDSGCGWPAFNDVLNQGLVKLTTDTSMGMIRTEVQCSKCDAHMGHVFEDGPKPTRKRFCINSASLHFTPAQPKKSN